jgi:hypothetical protein
MGFAEGSEPSLDQLKQAYEESREAAMQPVLDFQSRYTEELQKLADKAQMSGKLEEMLAVKEEIAGYQSGPISNLNQFPEVAKLREIYETNLAPLEAVAIEGNTVALQEYLTGVTTLVAQLTSAGKIDEALAANEVKQSLTAELAALQSAVSLPPVAPADSSGSNSIFVSEIETIPGLRGKAGRLRSVGTLRDGEVVLPEEVLEMDDFVKVYVFMSCWVAIRENGTAFIKYIRPNVLTIHTAEERSLEMISRGHDSWVMNSRNDFWRTSEPNSVVDLKKKPDGIIGSHCAGLAYWKDGSVVTWGSQFAANRQTPPPADFFQGAIGAGSGGSTMIAVDQGGTLRGWDIHTGSPIAFDGVSGVIELESGRGHVVTRKADGTVETFPTRTNAMEWDSATMTVPADLGGVPARVRAGGHSSAIQRTDGTWFAWGPNPDLNEAVKSAGIAIDLDIYGVSGDGFVIWIEPVN